MPKFTTVSQDLFKELQLDAGVLLWNLDIEKLAAGEADAFSDEDIIFATSGGISPACVANYSDFFEDVDNIPNGTMEGKHLDYWDCTVGFTSISFSAKSMQTVLGAADIEGEGTKTVTIKPRAKLNQSDFKTVYWAGDMAQDGKWAVIKMEHVLSEEGLTLQTTKNGKGTLSGSLRAHVSIKDLETVPMTFMIIDSTVTTPGA